MFAIALAGCHDHPGIPPGSDMAIPEDMSAGMDMLDMTIPDDAFHSVSYTDFAMSFAQALCDHYVKCGQLDAAQMPQCLERNLRHSGWDQDIEITKGRMQINDLQCLDAVKNARCDLSDSGAWSTRCLQFLYRAQVTNGGACIASEECMSGFCQHGGSDAGMAEQVTGCPGTCADPKPAGAACRIQSDCASNAQCNGSNQCETLGALGDACDALPCQFGLLCPTFPTTTPPKCSIPATQTMLHGACDPLQGGLTPTPTCAAGMYCQVQYSATTTACTGAPGDCATIPFGFCDTGTGFCQKQSGGQCEMKLASGTQCDPKNTEPYTFVDNQCADGTLCYQLTGQANPTCQAYGGSNGACLKTSGLNDTCKVGFRCIATSGAQGTCQPWIGDTKSCDATLAQCTSSQVNGCIADNADAGTATTCQTIRSFGVACNPGFEDSLCAPSDIPGSTYCAPTGSTGVCAPKCF